MKLAAVIIVLCLCACENPNQVRERGYYAKCPPGYACLSPVFAINRLKHDIWVTYDVKRKRFMQAKATDKDAIQIHEGGIVDFWRVPEYVVVTPSARVSPDESSHSASRARHSG